MSEKQFIDPKFFKAVDPETEARCAQLTLSGLRQTRAAGAPAFVVTCRFGRNRVVRLRELARVARVSASVCIPAIDEGKVPCTFR